MQNRDFTDAELVAYLDGENSLAPVDEIARALQSDAELARRVDALRIDRAAIAEAFAGLLPPEGSAPDWAALPERPAAFGWTSLAAAAALALVVGLGSGAWLQARAQSGWTHYVAAYQALYSNSTLDHINQSADAQQVELDRVAAAIGKTIRVETLTGFQEARYRRAQVLSFEGRALLQLAYTTSTGAPLALCIIRSERDRDAGPDLRQMEGLSTAWWAQDGYEYLLIGGTDDALVNRMAARFVSLEI